MIRVMNWLRSATFRRHATAWLALAAFSGAQLAVSAHACPPAKAAMTASEHADCHSAESGVPDAESPTALCKKHCENNGQQMVKAWPADLTAAIAAPVQPDVQLDDNVSGTVHRAGLAPQRVGIPDPPFLRSAVLRI